MQRKSLKNTIIEYLMLPSGWDGYSGQSGRLDSIVDALVFVESLPTYLACPKSMLASDGEVSVYWEFSDSSGSDSIDVPFYLEVSFPGDSTYHYIANIAQERIGVDNVPLETCISHPHLQNLLTRLPKRGS